jgi:Holliday junction resolvase RusA-like endonuclease
MKKVMKIECDVEGKPPRKNGANSLWATGEAQRVLDLRLKIHETQKENNRVGAINTPVKIELSVYAPNITNRKNTQTYVGDLDTFVAGICECIQSAHPKAKLSQIFEKHNEVAPHIPLIIYDDTQVVEIIAKKILSEKFHYTVIIEEV